MSLYDEVIETKCKFKTNKEALAYYQKAYDELTASYGLSGDEFWVEAESSDRLTQDYRKIMRLANCIKMAKYLVEKYENG